MTLRSQRSFERVAAEQGRLDGLVNNVFRRPIRRFTEAASDAPGAIWDDMVGIGCRAHYVASVHGAHDDRARQRPDREHLVQRRQPLSLKRRLRSRQGGRGPNGPGHGRGAAPCGVAAVSLWPGVVRTEFLLARPRPRPGACGSTCPMRSPPALQAARLPALARDPDVMEQTGLARGCRSGENLSLSGSRRLGDRRFRCLCRMKVSTNPWTGCRSRRARGRSRENPRRRQRRSAPSLVATTALNCMARNPSARATSSGSARTSESRCQIRVRLRSPCSRSCTRVRPVRQRSASGNSCRAPRRPAGDVGAQGTLHQRVRAASRSRSGSYA